ncbi:ATP-binding protein, partial [Klebsiella pneumoniae]|uniref:ATP-binding protein n=1 Tax=Klebsiella pneumoniae TaxID=573 RepID=UPI003218C8B1
RTDAGKVKVVLKNLIGNAAKFTERGSITVSAAASDDGVEFRVRDTGIGIPPDRQAAIFDSFTQVDGSTTRKYGGTGLGLTICRQLMALMGGEIGLESRPGAGSCFW